MALEDWTQPASHMHAMTRGDVANTTSDDLWWQLLKLLRCHGVPVLQWPAGHPSPHRHAAVHAQDGTAASRGRGTAEL